jgi:hypothetical protein
MVEKLLLNELVLSPAGTEADGGAPVDAEGAAEDDDELDAVVAVVLFFELLLHAAIRATNPSAAIPWSHRRGRGWLRTELIDFAFLSAAVTDCSP